MKIVVVGAGGVGGYFGGLLARNSQDLTFLARGAHLQALRERGLIVNSVQGDFSVAPVKATDDLQTVGHADLILVTVKDYQLEGLLSEMSALVEDQSVFLPLLNGLRAAERLAEAFGWEHVLGGLCRVVAFKAAPGVIEQTSPFRSITFGEWDGQKSPRTQAIYDALQAADVETELSPDIRKEMWTKFLFITAYSGVASVVRLPAGALRASPETMAMLRAAMEEIEAVAKAKEVALDSDVVDRSLDFFYSFPDEATASMQRDVEGGRMFELEALTGSVVRYGRQAGVPTPVNNFLYAALKPQELRVRNG